MRGFVKNRECGFTLVEMAVVMIIIGIAVAAAAPLYSVHMKKVAMQETRQNIEDVTNAIGNFRSIYGRYPCPASLTDPRDSADYGHEPKAPARPECSDTAQAVGTCANGVCIQQSIAARDLNPDPVLTDRPRVRIGWVPFRELGIPEESVFDAYGNRLSYAVTERLAVDTTFSPDSGGIEIREAQDQTALGAGGEGSAHFILFSHGVNGAGAFTKDGAQLPCAPAGSFEERNSVCSIAAGTSDSIFSMVQGDTSLTNSTFDDEISYFTKEDVPLWQASVSDPNDIHVKTTGAVGVYMAASSDVDERFSVSGDMQVDNSPLTVPNPALGPADCNNGEEGCLLTAEILDPNSGPAFKGYSANKIAGSLAGGGGMKCPEDDPDGAGDYMVAIRDGHPVCENQFAFAMCPPGEVMNGIKPDGTLECSGALPIACLATEKPDCEGNFVGLMLPAAPVGGRGQISSGISMISHYLCMSDGTWQFQNNTGNCNCQPRPNDVSTASCAAGFTGTRTITRVWDCGNGFGQWVVSSVNTSNCVCDPNRPPGRRTLTCPTGFNQGKITQRRDWTCVPTPKWGNWYTPPGGNTCKCAPKTTTNHYNCTGNLTGSGIDEERRFVCPGGPNNPGNWLPPVVVKNDCKCVDGRVETWVDNTACPAGETGSVTYKKTLKCPGATWSSPVEVSRDCEKLPPRICKWTSAGSGQSGQTVGLGQQRGSVCSCGTSAGPCHSGYGPYTNYTACTCQ